MLSYPGTVEIRKSVRWWGRWLLHARFRRKKFTFAMSSPDEFLSAWELSQTTANFY